MIRKKARQLLKTKKSLFNSATSDSYLWSDYHMDHEVEEHDVDKILKMFKDQNKLSNVISFSNCRIVKSEHAHSLRGCLTNTNNIQQFKTLNGGVGFWEIPSPNSDCGKIHKLQFILYTALLMKVLFKVVIHKIQFILYTELHIT